MNHYSSILHPQLKGLTEQIFKIDDRTIVLTKVYPGEGDDTPIELLDARLRTPVMARDPKTNESKQPNLGFLREAYKNGRLRPLHEPKNASELQKRFALLDPDQCADRDPKSVWKESLVQRAESAGIPLTDKACIIFLDHEYGRQPDDLKYPRPSASALRRWISSYRKSGRKRWALISNAGRPKGTSQLAPDVNAIVHENALYYWSCPNLHKLSAYARLEEQVLALPAQSDGSRNRVPSKTTFYKRVEALRCFDTVKCKYGVKEAERLYNGSGEAITAVDILDIALMDGTTLEQIIVFDENWQLPASKVRIVALMCALSHAIIGFHVYAGPNRTETSIEAVLSCITPPNVSAEGLKTMPVLGWIFGKMRALLPDNEKALIGLSTIDGFNELGIDVLMPPVEMPTAKAALERFFRFLKENLAQLPGTILDPKRAKELGYNLDGACLTLAQLRKVVESVIEQHNISPSKGLGGLSPAHVWLNRQGDRATPVFADIEHARRVLGRKVEALLTRDGIEINGIRYRDARIVTELLDNMSHLQKPRGRRKDGSITMPVTVKISPGNLESVQVLDEFAGEWRVIPSTQADYTAGLSEWEHKEFQRQAKRRNERFSTQEQRLASKRRTMALIEEMAPHVAFQQRRDMAALFTSNQVKKLSGDQFRLPTNLAETSFAHQATVEATRKDKGVRIKSTTSRRKGERPPVFENRSSVLSDDTKIVWDGIAIPAVEDFPSESSYYDGGL